MSEIIGIQGWHRAGQRNGSQYVIDVYHSGRAIPYQWDFGSNHAAWSKVIEAFKQAGYVREHHTKPKEPYKHGNAFI